MLLFLVAVVLEDGAQLRILAGIHALVVPVHRFEFFHQRNDRPVHVPCFGAKCFDRLVITLIGHTFSFFVGGQEFTGACCGRLI
jgi:hypothetical protein